MEKLAVEGKDHLLHHLNLNEVLEIKKTQNFYCLELGIRSLFSVGHFLEPFSKDREAFADCTEVTHAKQYQSFIAVSTSGGPWTSVCCKEVNSQEKKKSIFHSFIPQTRLIGTEEANEE